MTETQTIENTLKVHSNFDDLFPMETTTLEGQDKNILPEPPKSSVEDAPLPDVEDKVETPPTPRQKSDNKYKEKLRDLISDNVIEDFAVDVVGENGETTQVLASELKSVDKDLYKTLIDSYKEAKTKSIDEKYISREGLDEFTEKIIEVKKAGGSLAEAIQPNIKAVEQISDIKERLNNSEPNEALQTAVNIVAQDLQRKGLSERVIQAQIKDYVDNLEIDVIANEILDSHLISHKEDIEYKRQEELGRITKQREDQKNFRTALIAEYKELGISDNLKKVLVDNATNQDSENITNTDKLYFEASQDPKKFAKVNYMLNNLESFEDFISHKKVLMNKAQNLKSIITVNLGTVKKQVKTSESRTDDLFE